MGRDKDTAAPDPAGTGARRLPSPARLDLLLVLLAVTTAFTLRLVWFVRAEPAYLMGDLDRYINLALTLERGDFTNFINYHYFPGFPLIIAAFHQLGLPPEPAANLAAMACAALMAVPLYFLARTVFGRRTALIAVFLHALRFYDVVPEAQAEMAMLLIFVTALAVGARALFEDRPKLLPLAGALFGVGFLTKAEMSASFAMFGLASAVVLLGPLVRRPAAPATKPGKKSKAPPEPTPARRPRLVRALVILALTAAAYAVVVAPFLIQYHRDTGRISLNPKAGTLFLVYNVMYERNGLYRLVRQGDQIVTPGQNIYLGGDKHPLDVDATKVLFKYPGRWIVYFKSRFFPSLLKMAPRDFMAAAVPLLWPLLLMAGLFPDRRRWPREVYLHAFAVLPFLTVPWFSPSDRRMYLALLPWVIIVLARGLDRILEFIARARKVDPAADRRVPVIIIAGALAALAVVTIVQVRAARPDHERQRELDYRQGVARYVAQSLQPGERFMSQLETPSPWYLAGLTPQSMEILPDEDVPLIIEHAHAKKVSLILLFPSRFPGRYLKIIPLLQPRIQTPHLHQIFFDQSPAGMPYAIYRLQD